MHLLAKDCLLVSIKVGWTNPVREPSYLSVPPHDFEVEKGVI